MSNNSHIDKYLTETECLSEQQMLDYADNKLTARERHFAERHMLGCEMCADAVEGFAMINDRSVMDDSVFAVSAMAARADEKEEKKGFWTMRMRIAASVAILFLAGAAYFLQNNLKEQSNDTFAQNFEPYPVEKRSEGAEPPVANLMPPSPEVNETTQPANASKEELVQPLSRSENAYDMPAAVSEPALRQAPKANSAPAAKQEEVVLAETDNIVAIAPEEKSAEMSAANTASMDKEVAFNDAGAMMADTTPDPVYSVVTNNTASNSSTTISGGNSSSKTYFSGSDMASAPVSTGNSYIVNAKKQGAFKLKAPESSSKKVLRTTAAASESPGKEVNSTVNSGSGEAQNSNNASIQTTASDALSSSFLDQAMEKYKAGKYAEATPLFEQALASEPNNSYALFYSAVNYLGTNDHAKALVNLDKVLNATGHAFTGPARWYKALALVKKGDEKGAKVILQQIVKENGSYAKKAEELLKELK